MNARKLAYLHALEIDVWQRRDVDENGADTDRSWDRAVEPIDSISVATARSRAERPQVAREEKGPSRADLPAGAGDLLGADVSALSWDELAARVRGCTLCPLHVSRTQSVFGVGNRAADWMVIGEAPGADEDRQGEPFVGRAGQLLNSMLRAIGLKREQVFIANILKSRPPNNRDPRPEEVRACIPYLYRQIDLVDPKLILCVGRIAAQTLLETDTPIGKLRGKLHRLAARRMIVTYHPAYLLRSPGEKRKAWSDLMLAVKTYEAQGG